MEQAGLSGYLTQKNAEPIEGGVKAEEGAYSEELQ